MKHYNNTLEDLAKEALAEHGLLAQFPADALREVEAMKPKPLPEGLMDLRSLFFVSIDNEDSRDLDQLTYAKGNRIYISVADVNAYVKAGSAVDAYARHNTTSIYTSGGMFPMLPLKLSNDLTSLNENCDRSSFIVELEVDKEGKSTLKDLYPALVRNQKKLAYPQVARWLTGEEPWPSEELRKQLVLQDRLAQRMLKYRTKQGALRFATIELRAILQQGVAIKIEERAKENRAEQLIENFMIAANVGVTRYFIDHKLPVLRRVVRVPKRWNRIVELAKSLGTKLPSRPNPEVLRDFLFKEQKKHPEQFPDLSIAVIKLIGRGEYVALGKEGHFDLALRDYAHTTAPNRRYPDLVMQRILKAHLFGTGGVSKKELSAIARQCTEKESEVMKVERRMIKCAAAMVMSKDIGKRFHVMVTGASPKGTWVRLAHPPIEGKLTRDCEGLDVGDRITVELLSVDVRKGHIDFGKCGRS